MRPCLAVSAQSKLESEIATMSLVAERTTIPVPNIIAYSLAETSDPLSTYIIMEYVDGGTLSIQRLQSATAAQRDNLYKSLAQVYIQLRRLEFPAIGRLASSPRGFQVCRRALTIDVNGLQIEGLNPFATQASYHAGNDTLDSANEYIAMRLQISWNAFLNSRNNIEPGMAASVLYHLQLFCKHVEKWKDATLDRGPFVLAHGDLGPQNLIVDDSLEIRAVIDWEWSRVIPLQLFTPPLWLTGRDNRFVTAPKSYKFYLTIALSHFLEAVKTQELSTFNQDRLFQEWTSRKDNAEPLVANALENWTDIDWFAYLYLSRGDDDKLEEEVRSFIEADPIRSLITRMKEDDAAAYAEGMPPHRNEKACHDAPRAQLMILYDL
ncbi:phosphotransferase enzyme family protein [Metarhizium album ARSEF 1941]|uniref:Phosphotransferase enzyme family protein n=1 Tax=Metarhizium album (strain ARSEF 1941) TaxID=1081103 RepID=A0A0B2WJ77_METAS|nr:phosphotransferase enzyme family protein [Metarhizium album ARSEF 1941]KHN96096.1 phosphotransferase enzyme family protein [Metarhizium album ARSEF 1941]